MKILMLGAGITGKAVRNYILRHTDDSVVLYDDNICSERKDDKNLVNGGKIPTGIELIIKSPGIPPDHPVLKSAFENSIPVKGAMEYAAERLSDETIIAVTGTNGKSTTVSLIGDMLEHDGKKVFIGGNIGNPLVNAIDNKYDFIVTEISSYQLENLKSLRPDVGLILNVTPDHLDRYNNYEEYVITKASLSKLIKPNGVLILNGGDETLCHAVSSYSGKIRYFSVGASSDIFYENGIISHEKFSFPFEESTLDGEHNIENIMAAYLAVKDFISNTDSCVKALREFTPLKHRMQYVDTINGVVFFNDSKGTNVGAVEKSMKGFGSRELILICGGRDKGSSYRPLRFLADELCSGVVVMGEAADKIACFFEDFPEFKYAADMEDAVKKAFEIAHPGSTVLFSPACSSFDMYKNFMERGEDFMNKVLKLKRSLCV